ncbi:MinD type ATPase [Capsaspora owczarzaki ATCC 30864]|uniref:MinD type ATPase n=1 Tax=Capsaspora owczarzaki (strain ATCC 30864) TaxID=595528 RepID=UPI0003520908|nr:MinD type ATPase [Capsaspora owczarzaki ATCC 30864]|eukprot:XP_004348293.2 MinD type ATPase [Capsaspora owczarzaki ATCC 30864]
MRLFGQLVVGPAGAGKSSYCAEIVQHCQTIGRSVFVVNLDPAAEHFDYPVALDVRDLINLTDVIEGGAYGPNGGLVFCMEYLLENISWLHDQISNQFVEDDYILFDCPGQIELYTHLNIMRRIVDEFQQMDMRMCGVYLLDSQFIEDMPKFFAGVLSAMSVMVQLEIPHVNVLTKVDKLGRAAKSAEFERFLDFNASDLMGDTRTYNPKLQHLNRALATVIDEHSLVQFVPLNVRDKSSIARVMFIIDNSIQYGEDLDIDPRFDKEQEETDGLA